MFPAWKACVQDLFWKYAFAFRLSDHDTACNIIQPHKAVMGQIIVIKCGIPYVLLCTSRSSLKPCSWLALLFPTTCSMWPEYWARMQSMSGGILGSFTGIVRFWTEASYIYTHSHTHTYFFRLLWLYDGGFMATKTSMFKSVHLLNLLHCHFTFGNCTTKILKSVKPPWGGKYLPVLKCCEYSTLWMRIPNNTGQRWRLWNYGRSSR